MGQIIPLHIDDDNPKGLYKFELPSIPKETDIWYHNVRKSDQFFKTPANQDFRWLDSRGNLKNVRQMSEKERITYITYWREKIEEGLWIMINGEPVWLTGMHVEHLIFNRFKSVPFLYDDEQRFRFYFRKLTNEVVICDGRLWCKGRRVGITMEEVTEAVHCMNDDFGNHIGAQSDTHPKAKSTILKNIIDVYTKRPSWTREVFYSSNGKIPREKLELIDGTLKDEYELGALGGIARAFPTTVKAMDGEEFMLVIMDEFSKWADIDPREAFDVNVKTIVNPGKRGKLDALSTTGDSKEAKKAVTRWHQMISDSNPKVLNANGRTNNGLWHWFVAYIHSFELLERYPQIRDKFGKVNRDMAETIIWEEVKQFPVDSKEYIFALYRMPMTMRHTLLTPTGQGYFSKLRITKRLEELRALPNDRKPYVWGSLEYDQRGRVYFESNAERWARCEKEGIKYVGGFWKIALHPYFSVENNIDTRNRFRIIDGIKFPPINPEFEIGFDPIRYRKEDTTSTHLSDASIIIKKKHDYFGANDANRYAALWLHRPDDPRDANRESIKACLYFGAPMFFERVMDAVKEDFENANAVPFLRKSSKDDVIGMIIDSLGKTVKNALDWMVTEFGVPKTDEDIDQIGEQPFEEVLVDLDGIDIGNTTAFNVFMSMVELQYGLKQNMFTNLTDKSHRSLHQISQEIFSTAKI